MENNIPALYILELDSSAIKSAKISQGPYGYQLSAEWATLLK